MKKETKNFEVAAQNTLSGRTAGYVPFYKDENIVLYNNDYLNIIDSLSPVNLIICDPPYMEGITNYFDKVKSKLKPNGSLLWFTQPTELYDLPEKPLQVLVWTEPPSPKPIHKKYREFLDFIAWYGYGNYTFNKQLWNLMNSRFDDIVIRDVRLHKWEKPETLIEKLILVHTNTGDLILDPFSGSGTVLAVAKKLGRKAVGIEISTDECNKIVKRINPNSNAE
jgi:DNA modification methylase